jgi:hypothetical protein
MVIDLSRLSRFEMGDKGNGKAKADKEPFLCRNCPEG